MPQTNPRSLANLKRGGTHRRSGRPPIVREARDWERNFLQSDEYRESARKRVLEGRAPHLESLWHNHVWPKDARLQLGFQEGATLKVLQVILPPGEGL